MPASRHPSPPGLDIKWSDSQLRPTAFFRDGAPQSSVSPRNPSPEASFAANDYGLYDMAGNVHEWCWDRYGSLYYGTETTDPRGPASGVNRVGRGGGWASYAIGARCAYRHGNPPSFTVSNYGFRTARSVVP